jgi:phenylpropionate dioxygenase-like ring-hydroxylating dioxygenase large terminal subunit
MSAVQKRSARVVDRDTSNVPYRITDEAYVPAARYTNQEFHDLEKQRLWPRTWQVACREDEIPRAGDFVEYKITDYSILVVRTKTGGVSAFHNACPHRATQLGRGSGSYPTGEIVCPFHGWKFDLEGQCTYVYSPQGFRADTVAPEKTALKSIQADTRWGLVWINMDASAPPLEQCLGELVEFVDPLRMDQMRVHWWKQIRLEANWKVSQEAFFEAYHIMQSHPEMALFANGDDFRMHVVDALNPRLILKDKGHWAHTAHAFDPANAPKNHKMHEHHTNSDVLIMRNRAMYLGAQATMPEWAYKIQEDLLASGVAPDENFGMILMQKVRESASERNVPIPAPNPKATSWAHAFPNLTFLSGYGSVLMYRSRPAENDPNACIYDFWSLEFVAEGTEARRPVQASDEFFESMWVVQQDKGNIERQQIGLRSLGHTENRLATNYEKTISVFHQHLDQVLAQE